MLIPFGTDLYPVEVQLSEQVHKSFHRFERRFDFGLFSFLEGYAGGVPRFRLRPFFRVGIGVDYKRYSFYVGDDWSQISYSDSALSNYAWVFGIGYRF